MHLRYKSSALPLLRLLLFFENSFMMPFRPFLRSYGCVYPYIKTSVANWRTRSGTRGSVEERYTGTLHGRTSKILATWQIDSYPRQADAYLCLKRAIYRRFERKIGRISCPTFRGKVMWNWPRKMYSSNLKINASLTHWPAQKQAD